jgi:hypothetical protein
MISDCSIEPKETVTLVSSVQEAISPTNAKQFRACLDHFAKTQNFTVAKESYQFEVLNEVYL